jgi:hypothetical protein
VFPENSEITRMVGFVVGKTCFEECLPCRRTFGHVVSYKAAAGRGRK